MDERPSKNYPQKLTTQRQKTFESHFSSTLMRVKFVPTYFLYFLLYTHFEIQIINSRAPQTFITGLGVLQGILHLPFLSTLQQIPRRTTQVHPEMNILFFS